MGLIAFERKGYGIDLLKTGYGSRATEEGKGIPLNRYSVSSVRAILLDPSCSGSGTSTNRLDYLLPSYDTVPSVERVVYSTCSIHQEENEDVIKTILPIAESLNFHLEAPFPQWPRRGLPVFGGAEHLLRIDPADGMEGFFISLFVRKHSQNEQEELKCEKYSSSVDCISKAREDKFLTQNISLTCNMVDPAVR
ncbi:hypothetical protein EJ110_NYTH11374 [Nymphaea thermarum]|nr:hypothetical protein EJ110_NYTH11374 [Nymphaea thermarum]